MQQKGKGAKPPVARHNNRVRLMVVGLGAFLALGGLMVLFLIYYPVVVQEVKYLIAPGKDSIRVASKKEIKDISISARAQKQIIYPVNEQFGIVIPKIGANSAVIQDVSPFNEKEYQQQLTNGVAHARDTALPGEPGNMFIFAHSAASTFEANRYNAVFYLLGKLEREDSIYVFFKGRKYRYQVRDSKLVNPESLEHLKQDRSINELTLMTCWPPGTTLKRRIVRAVLATE